MCTKTEWAGSCRRLGGAATLCFFLLAAGAVEVGDAASAVEPAVIVPPVEHEVILTIAREYRRSASPAWLETLADAIYEESVRAAVDPLLVASIVAMESSFRDTAVSPIGAVGLMQLRPAVADDLAERLDLEGCGPQALSSPSINVRLGILYYKELMERFEGDAAKALTAYNYGPTLVSHQIREGTYAGSAYAAQVLSLYGRLGASRPGEV